MIRCGYVARLLFPVRPKRVFFYPTWILNVGMVELGHTSAYAHAQRNVVRLPRGAATPYNAEGRRIAREARPSSGRRGLES